jgi:hypothetical protein
MLRNPNKEQVPCTDSCFYSKPQGKIPGNKHRSSSDTIRGMVCPRLRGSGGSNSAIVQLYQRYVNVDMVALLLSLLKSSNNGKENFTQ